MRPRSASSSAWGVSIVNGRIAGALGALVGLAVATVMGLPFPGGLVTTALLSSSVAPVEGGSAEYTNAELTLGSSAVLGLHGTATTAAQRARTRGFATPAFAGCAFWMRGT